MKSQSVPITCPGDKPRAPSTLVMAYNSHRPVLSGENGAMVIPQRSISSTPSSFQDFFRPYFDDKTLAIEAFLRNGLSHHLVLRPRRCGKSFTLSMIRLNYLLLPRFCNS